MGATLIAVWLGALCMTSHRVLIVLNYAPATRAQRYIENVDGEREEVWDPPAVTVLTISASVTILGMSLLGFFIMSLFQRASRLKLVKSSLNTTFNWALASSCVLNILLTLVFMLNRMYAYSRIASLVFVSVSVWSYHRAMHIANAMAPSLPSVDAGSRTDSVATVMADVRQFIRRLYVAMWVFFFSFFPLAPCVERVEALHVCMYGRGKFPTTGS